MRKLVGRCGLLALFFVLFIPLTIVPAMAQDQPGAGQNTPAPAPTKPVKVKRTYITPRFELSAGYSYRSYYAPIGTLGMNGWYGSVNYNFKRWLGAEAEVVGVGKNQGFSSALDLPLGDTHIYTFLVGPTIFPLGHRKLTPFGHVLYGGAHYRNAVPVFAGVPSSVVTSTVKSWEAGGGLDFNFSSHWGVRLIEADFGSANFFPSTSTFTNRGTHRVSFGIVYRFGER
jgi:opacity protein-like surface antigen